MIWLSEILGVLECGCQVDAGRVLVSKCPAHCGEGEVRLERFSLDQAAEVRRLKTELSSKSYALQRAMADRAKMHLRVQRDTKKCGAGSAECGVEEEFEPRMDTDARG
jgi:hypothetical protein